MFEGIDIGRLRQHMVRMEGEKYVTYDCQGLPHGGIGHLLLKTDPLHPDNGSPLGTPIPAEQVAAWFEADVQGAYDGARFIAGVEWERWSPVRREVLVDLCFQCGVAGAKKFKKCIAAFLGGMWGIAAVEQLDSRMAKQTPRRAMSRAKALVYDEW